MSWALRRAMLGTLLLMAAPGAASESPGDVGRVLAQAARDGVPTGVLAAKANEGLAKGVDPARVTVVVDTLRRELIDARSLVGDAADDPGPDGLSAVAAARRAGASPVAVIAIGDLPAQLRVPAWWSLADLLAGGVSEGDASRLVAAAARSPQPATNLRGLAAAVGALVAAGEPPRKAAAAVLGAVDAGLSPLNAAAPDDDSPPASVGRSGSDRGVVRGGRSDGRRGTRR